jgi:hypothetical protein
MVTYGEIVAVAVIAAPIVTTIIIIGLIILKSGKNNTTFLVIKTFNRSEVPIFYKGRIKQLRDRDNLMSEAIITKEGKKTGIGTFHQKFIMPFGNKRYLMILEEWDVGRYRPMQRLEGYGLSRVWEAQRDAQGKPIYDLEGKRKFEEKVQRVGVLEPVSNDDFEYIRHKLAEVEKRYEIKQKDSQTWKYIAGGFIVVVILATVIMSAYYNYQTAVELKNGAVTQTQSISETIYKLFSNETIREAARVAPPKDNRPAPPG